MRNFFFNIFPKIEHNVGNSPKKNLNLCLSQKKSLLGDQLGL